MSKPLSRVRAGQDRATLYDEITDNIIAELEAGRVPWVQPWGTAAAKAPLALPKNASTDRTYSGINVLLLWGSTIEHGFTGQSWLTFRQALSLGGHVCKGERGTTVVYADRFVPGEEKRRAAETGEEAQAIPFLKRFTVFNTDQCELPGGIATAVPPPPPALVEPRVEALIKATGITFRIGGDRAFYAPAEDYVQVPPPQAYFEPINWHRTALHELGHATGHPSRLNRDLSGSYGTKKYAFEELVAELSAAFGCASLGIVPTVRHADYIGAWLEVLREDNRAIVRAASQASKAADYLLAFAPDPVASASAGPEVGDCEAASCLPGRCLRESERRGGLSATGWRSRESLLVARRGEAKMTKAVQKITLSPSRDIPFNKLVLSQSNVRRVKAGVSIEQLAESIAQRTLLQSLSVRAVLDAEKNETGMFEVPAGGRRYRALELLVKQKRMAKTQPVPCVVREGGIAEDDSLAENDERVGLHPLDQFRAFKTLSDTGMSEEDIAARHFVSPAIVKQRLRLASVSPKLHEVYAEDGMTLEQLMAFSVTADQLRQEQVWENVSRSGHDEPYQIRRGLTEQAVRASNRRARFVGVDAYEQAGGGILRDLFEHDDGGWLQDVALLDRLVNEKLTAEAETIAKEGWKWISLAVEFSFGHAGGLRELEGKPADLTIEEQATIDALNAEQAKLEFDYQDADELPDDVDQRLSEIEAALMAFEDRSAVYDPADIARVGVFVSIDYEGRLAVDRGYVRSEDEPTAVDSDLCKNIDTASTEGQRASTSVQHTAISVAGHPAAGEEDDEDAAKPLPDRLITELTAHRTLALRDALAENPAITFQAVLHNLVLTTFYRFASSGTCLEIGLHTPTFPAQAPGLKESASAKAIDARHESWKARLPKSEADLWEALTALDGTAQACLLAHCASFAVNALYEPASRTNQGRVSAHGVRTRLDQADVLSRAVGLDMVRAGWRPTVDNYLGRVTKPRILEAVREAKRDSSAQLIDHLKKADMAKEAERLLDGSGWLPEPIRLVDIAPVPVGQEGEAGALPEFLADEEDGDVAADDDRPQSEAAE